MSGEGGELQQPLEKLYSGDPQSNPIEVFRKKKERGGYFLTCEKRTSADGKSRSSESFGRAAFGVGLGERTSSRRRLQEARLEETPSNNSERSLPLLDG